MHSMKPQNFTECGLVALFEEQVARTPEHPAVAFEDVRLSYNELNARANQLAHHLRMLGVGPDVLVGLCVERSVEMIVGILGILKAGGAYVPLDPDLPADRLAFIMEDIEAPVLVIQRHLEATFPNHRAHTVYLDEDAEAFAQGSTKNPAKSAEPDHLVYVLFTSGSTGKPKGVLVEHRPFLAYLRCMMERLDLAPVTSYAVVSSFAADVGHTAIFASLITGAYLHILSKERSSNPDALAAYFQRYPVDFLKLVPSHMEALLTSAHPERVLPRKRLIFGGEACSWTLIDQVQSLAPDCVIHAHFGLTETTVGVITYQVSEDPATRFSAKVPIGRPIPNAQVYLLDPQGQFVDSGEVGELYIGGNCLARGYLGRPDLTAERFITDPFSSNPEARLYKTGDLARVLPDGAIEFLGRLDDQVKIRGYRVEFGEIEAVLRQHAAVREGVVMAREDQTGDRKLVAYLVPRSGQQPTISLLRGYLQANLPDYMVPSSFVMLEALPLMPNGKLDRKALPAPEVARSMLDAAFVAPRTSMEEAITKIWADVLGLKQIGVHDNFFDLGGHSLFAMRVIARIRDRLEVKLPLSALFDTPTVAELAQTLSKHGTAHDLEKRTSRLESQGTTASSMLAIPQREEGSDLPVSFAQQRLWFLEQLQPGNAFYNVVRGARLQGPLYVEALQRALDAVVVRHEVLRTRLVASEGTPQQVVDLPRSVQVRQVDLSDQENPSVHSLEQLLREESRQPFDLAQDLMLRALLVRLAPEEHALLLVGHHIAIDGWSLPILYRDLATFYEAFSNEEVPALPDLPVQYADFAVWQRQWLRGGVITRQRDYWKGQLQGMPPLLKLPADFPRPTVQTFRGAQQALAFPTALAQELRTLSRREGVTLFMTLLAAYTVLLAYYSDETDITIGVNTAGRSQVETEDLIGFFTNMIALRSDLSGNPTFREVLGRVRATALEGYAHQDVPFEMVIEAVQPRRDPSYTPLFQTVFSLQDAAASALEIPGLASIPIQVDNKTAKFDLVLDVIDNGGALHGLLEYNTDLFKSETAVQLLKHYADLLNLFIEQPNVSINSLLESLSETHKQEQMAEAAQRGAANLKKLKTIQRKSIRQSPS